MTTRIRYEVWVSDTGEASHWKLLRNGVWFNRANAESMARVCFDPDECKRVCVEAWDDGRNVYLRTVYELGSDPEMI